MKKIDLHIHTVPSDSDAHFDFDIDKLTEYAREANLDGIAITNHNLFDLTQYHEICENLKTTTVFPGIEVDVDTCHILVIATPEKAGDFDQVSQRISQARNNTGKSLAVEDFIAILEDPDDYLIIPHYKKNPIISDTTSHALKQWLTCGEVNSAKKFVVCSKNHDSMVPVIFSDVRIRCDLRKFPVRQTYINCGDLTLQAMKSCLTDKSKVFLSKSEGNSLFQVLDDGLHISTGLNVLLGKRSSGKTYALNSIHEQVNRVKYIKQFSLVQGSSEEHEDIFNTNIAKKRSGISEEYLTSFRNVLEDVKSIDASFLDKNVDAYISSLKKYASEIHLHDIFSNATLFSETPFPQPDNKVLIDLIQSTQNLIENLDYKDIIFKHVHLNSLKKLACELIELLWINEEDTVYIDVANGLITNIQSALAVRSASTKIEDVNLLDHILDNDKVEKFEDIVNFLHEERIIIEKDIQGYNVVGKKQPYRQVSEIKENLKGNPALLEAFKSYHQPYKYLQNLLEIDALSSNDIYKCFVNFTYQVYNKEGFTISGGERSEFRLLQEIQDATKYDLLLIDEPESSFDNNFLRANVNSLIKDIARNMPIVVVTHNSTVGGSIKPDYLLYASRERIAESTVHKLYTGHPTDKELRCVDGTKIETHDVYLNSLEAGETAYSERRQTYETVKN